MPSTTKKNKEKQVMPTNRNKKWFEQKYTAFLYIFNMAS
jgi:hypothetical protein